MNLWNVKNLSSPPVSTYKVKTYDVDIVTLRSILSEALNTFKNQKKLHEEAAILSRCIYRLKLKFRTDKGLKGMEKMNHALLHYLRMNILSTVRTIYDMVPQKYTHNTYLPTCNMLHYLLVQIQGLSKLLARIMSETKIAAEFMQCRIGIGHFWNVSFICFGVCSRIYVLVKSLTEVCCKIYNQLLPYTNVLKNVGADWLPQDYNLPKDLKVWLDVDWLNTNLKTKTRFKKPTIFDIGNIVDSDSDLEISGEYTEINDDLEIVGEFVEIKDEPELFTQQINVEDIGEAVVRNTELENIGEVKASNTSSTKMNTKKKKKRKQQQAPKSPADVLINNINTLKDLKVFARDFNKIQNEYAKVFMKLDKMQCSMLHSVIKKCVKKAKKHSADQSKVNVFISEAKEALQLSLR